jgi:hypothetical protein
MFNRLIAWLDILQRPRQVCNSFAKDHIDHILKGLECQWIGCFDFLKRLSLQRIHHPWLVYNHRCSPGSIQEKTDLTDQPAARHGFQAQVFFPFDIDLGSDLPRLHHDYFISSLPLANDVFPCLDLSPFHVFYKPGKVLFLGRNFQSIFAQPQVLLIS